MEVLRADPTGQSQAERNPASHPSYTIVSGRLLFGHVDQLARAGGHSPACPSSWSPHTILLGLYCPTGGLPATWAV